VVAVRRGDTVMANPGPGQRLEAGDVLIVLAGAAEMAAAADALAPDPTSS
jgi:K+/H+ antiporter YhaU regulatory subunit KhtT